MGRKPRDPHELVPQKYKGGARVTYRGKSYHLGPWDRARDRPSDEAVARLETLRAIWRGDPDAMAAGARAAGSPLLVAAWADWRASPEAPPEHAGDYRLVAERLFGTPAAPGPHLLTPVADFGPAELLAFQSGLVADDLSRWTVSRRVSIVKQFFGWAVARGLAEPSLLYALDHIPAPQRVKEKEERGIATPEQVEAAAAAITSAAGDLLRLLALTGARPGEISGEPASGPGEDARPPLTVGAIQRGGVWRSKKGLALDLGKLGVWAAEVPSKTRRKGIQRVLFFGPRAQALLAPRLAGRKPAEPVFLTSTGEPYTPRLLRRYVQLACERKGCARFSPYEIRHGVAARVQQEFGAETPGLGYLAAQAVLGHAIKGATQGYAAVDYACAARVMAAMG